MLLDTCSVLCKVIWERYRAAWRELSSPWLHDLPKIHGLTVIAACVGIAILSAIMVYTWPYSDYDNAWIEANWTVSVVFFSSVMCNLLSPAMLTILAARDRLDPLVNICMQTSVVILNAALTTYTMVRTGYNVYIAIGSVCFIGPTVLAWSYQLPSIWNLMTLERPAQPAVFLDTAQDLFEVADIGPLDEVYRQQLGMRLHHITAIQHPLQRNDDPAESRPPPLPTSEAPLADETLATPMRSRLGSVSSATGEDSAAVMFSTQIRVWDNTISRYVAFLAIIFLEDIMVIVFTALSVYWRRAASLRIIWMFNLIMPWSDLGLIISFVATIQKSRSNSKDLGVFAGLFVISFLVWMTPIIVMLSTYQGADFDAKATVNLLYRFNGSAAAVHGILAVYAVRHFIRVIGQQRRRAGGPDGPSDTEPYQD